MIGCGREHLVCRRGVHKDELGVGFGAHSPAPGHAAALEMKWSRETVVSQPQLDDPASSAEMLTHGRKHACRDTQDGWHEPKYEYKKMSLHESVNPELNYACTRRND